MDYSNKSKEQLLKILESRDTQIHDLRWQLLNHHLSLPVSPKNRYLEDSILTSKVDVNKSEGNTEEVIATAFRQVIFSDGEEIKVLDTEYYTKEMRKYSNFNFQKSFSDTYADGYLVNIESLSEYIGFRKFPERAPEIGQDIILVPRNFLTRHKLDKDIIHFGIYNPYYDIWDNHSYPSEYNWFYVEELLLLLNN